MKNCNRMTVHAIGIDRDGELEHATNYNTSYCTSEPGGCGCTHAEIALLEKMPNPKAVFVTHSPCMNCAQALIDAGVELVYFGVPYRKQDGWDYLYQNGVITRPITL